MPSRNFIKVKIPPVQPDRCLDCPLLGVIPKELRKKGSQQTYVCLGTYDAMSARFIRSRVSEADKNHVRHRWCENYWNAWVQLPEQKFSISTKAYNTFRKPYEEQMMFTIKFHTGNTE